MSVAPRPPVKASGYQRFVSAAFLVAVLFMVTNYAVVKYGPALVLITPFAVHSGDDFAYEPQDQAGGLYVINWRVLDECFYKLDDGRFLPPAEGLVALLCLLALPLLLILGPRRQIWPGAPVILLVALGLVSCLAAEHFNAAAREVAQLVLTCLAGWWLAGAAVADEGQAKRLHNWLGVLTIALVALASWEYWRFVQQQPGAEQLTFVRATCQSRAAFSGLMVMLLSLAFGRVVAGRNLIVRLVALAVCLLGLTRLMNAGAVLGLLLSWSAICGARFRGGWFFGGLAVLVAAGIVLHQVSPRQLDYLQESVQFYVRREGTPVRVEKRYLESAAALGGLREKQAVVGEAEPETGSAPVLGWRSNILLGVGAGLNYQKVIGQYYGNLDNPEKQEPDTQNLYLLLALQMGLFAAIAWAWLLLDGASLARRAAAGTTDGDLEALALGVAGACLGLLVFSVFGTILIRGTGLLLFALLGVVARLEWLSRPVAEAALTPGGDVASPESDEPEWAAEAAAARPVEELPEIQDTRAWLKAQGLLEEDEAPDQPADSGSEPGGNE